MIPMKAVVCLKLPNINPHSTFKWTYINYSVLFFLQFIGTLAIFVKQTKKKTKKRKDLLSVFELISFVKDSALFIIKKASHKSTDHQDHANVSTYWFL